MITDNYREFKVFIGNRCVFVGGSWTSVENFIRENDRANRELNGWDCELDDYEVVCIR